MSRLVTYAGEDRNRFPRVSGDEPTIRFTAPAGVKFSPRERG